MLRPTDVAVSRLRGAIGSLGRLPQAIDDAAIPGNDAAVPLLEKLARSTADPTLSVRAMRGLRRIVTDDAIGALARLARLEGDLGRTARVELADVDDRQAVDSLLQILSEEMGRGSVATAVVRALGKTRDRRLVPVLTERLNDADGDVSVRRESAEALGSVADPAAIESLSKALRDADDRVRRTAIRALGRIRSDDAIRELERRLGESPGDHEAELIRDALAALRGEQRSPFRSF